MFHVSWILSGLSTGIALAYGWYRLRAWHIEAKMARLLPLEQLLAREARKAAPSELLDCRYDGNAR